MAHLTLIRLLPLLALVALSAAALARPAAAQGGPLRLLVEPVEENRFPEGLAFGLVAESTAEIREVRFRYTFLPENRSSSAQAEFEPGTRVQATFNLRSAGGQRYIPPGKQLRYSWEIRDAAGNELIVPARETTFADTRFAWQEVKDGPVSVNYYRGGGQRDAEIMAAVARETVEKAAKLMGTNVDFPIRIWAYNNQRDFQIALAHESVSSDPGVLGQAHEPDTFIMVVDRLSSPSAFDTARHELTHLVTARAVARGPYAGLYPSWLNEGTAVYLQVSPNDVGYVDAVEKAIRDDKTIPLKSLTAGTRNRDVGLFYGQGYSVVNFLVKTYGEAKFAQMIDAFNKTGQIDEAFKQTYGTDQDGIYRAWRESVGLSADQRVATPVPDIVDAQPAPEGDDNTGLLIGLGMGALVLLLIAAVAGGILLARRAGMWSA